jgi:hypothetical protein
MMKTYLLIAILLVLSAKAAYEPEMMLTATSDIINK